MSGSNVSTEVVALEFDGRGFRKGIDRALRNIADLQKGLRFRHATEGLSAIDEAGKKVSFAPLERGVESVTTKLSMMSVIAATVVSKMTMSIMSAGKKLASEAFIRPMRDGLGEFELQMNSIQTILANTKSKGTVLGDVNKALDELNHYADLTIYNFADMTSSIGKFTAAGVGLETSVGAIKGISNLAAVSGSSSAEASMAMYQLSQAISSGTVRLMDWNSVVNAGMGGEVFKNALIDTARVSGVAIDSILDKTGGFRESLSEGWLTSQIMLDTLSKFTGDMSATELEAIGYTEEQIADILELGEIATDAATKVKTLGQVKDVFFEALGSGWASSWRIIFGDFNTARNLFTGLSEWLGSFISKSANARNVWLTRWEKLGGRLAAINIFKDVAGKAEKFAGIIKDAIDSIFPPGDKGKQYANATKAVLKFIEGFRLLAKNTFRFKVFVRGLAAGLDILFSAVKAVVRVIKEMTEGLGGPAFEAVLNAMEAFGHYMVALRKTVKGQDTFYKSAKNVGVYLQKLGKRIKTFVGYFVDVVGQFRQVSMDMDSVKDRLHRFVMGLVAGLDIIFMAFEAIGRVWSEASKNMTNVGGPMLEQLLDWAAAFGDYLTTLRDTIKTNDSFYVGLKKGIASVQGFIARVRELAVSFSELKVIAFMIRHLKAIKREDFVAMFERFQTTVGKISAKIKRMNASVKRLVRTFSGLKIVKKVVAWFNDLSFDDIKKAVQPLVDVFTTIRGIFTKTEGTADNFRDSVQDLTFVDRLIEIMHAFDGIFENSWLFGKKSEDTTSNLDTVESSVNSVGDSMKFVTDTLAKLQPYLDRFKTWASNATAKILDAIAEHIRTLDFREVQAVLGTGLLAMITGAIYSLAKKNTIGEVVDKVIKSLFGGKGLSARLDTIVSPFKALEGVLTSYQNNLKASTLMKIAGAIGVLTLSIIALSFIESSKLAVATAAIGALLVELFGSASILNNMSTGDTAKSAGLLIALSLALLAVAAAVKKLAEVDPDRMAQGLAAVTGAMAALVLATRGFKGDTTSGMIKAAAGLVVLSGALLVVAIAVKRFGDMDPDVLENGLIAVAGTIMALVGATRLVKEGELLKGAAAMVLMAGATYALSYAVERMGNIDWEHVARGLITMGASLGILTLAIRSLPKKVQIKSAAVAVLSGAMMLLSKAFSNMADLEWEEIARGLVAMAGGMIIMVLGLKAMGDPESIAGAVSLVGASVGLLAMGEALKSLAGLEWEEIARGLVGMGGGLLELSVALYAMTGTAAGAAALIIASVGLMMMAKAIIMLSKLSLKEVAVGLGVIAGAFVILGLAGAVLSPVIPALLGLGAAMALIGVGLGIVGIGIGVAAMGLGALILAMIALFKLVEVSGDVVIETIPKIAEAITNAFISSVLSIGESIPEFVEMGTDLIMALLDAIEEIAPKAMETVGVLIESMLDVMVEKTPSFMEKGLTILIAFLDGIADNIKDVVVSAGKVASEFLRGLGERSEDMVDAAFSFILDLMTALEDGIDEYLPEIIERSNGIGIAIVKGLIEGAIGQFTNLATMAQDIGDTALTAIKEVFDSHSPSRKTHKIGVDVIVGLIDGSQEQINDWILSIGEMMGGALEAFRSIIPDFALLGIDYVTSMTTAYIETFVNALERMMAPVMTLLLDLIDTEIRFFTYGVDTVKAISQGFIEQFVTFSLDVMAAISGLLVSLIARLEDFVAYGKDTISSMSEGVESGLSRLQEALAYLMTDIYHSLDVAVETFKAKGLNIVKGLAEGILNSISVAVDAANALAAAVADAVSSAWEEHSPSKLFFRKGVNATLGLIGGMESLYGTVEKTAKALKEKAQNGISMANDMLVRGFDDVAYAPVIRPVLDMTDVDSGMRLMEGRFSGLNAHGTTETASRIVVTNKQRLASQRPEGGTVQYIQNNYSPKALSPAEIYRQTNNQISRLRRRTT